MAHGSDESEDYWPGYVDALTSMVQVLAFVMMLLAMAVFVLSQNVAKGAVEAIAKAAKIDVAPDAGIAEVTAKILEIVNKAPPAPTPAPGDSAAEAGGVEKKGDPSKPALAAAPSEKAISTDAGVVDQKGEAIRSARSRASSESIANSALRQKPSEIAPEAKVLVVPFRSSNFALDPPAQAAIGAFVGEQNLARSGTKILVRGFANPGGGSISEARRLAYYRAVNVRRDLLAQHVPADAIQVRIFDTPDPEQGRSVEVVAEPESVR